MTEHEQTFLFDFDPANLLPYSKQIIPADPEAFQLPRAHHQSRMFDDDYGSRSANR
jgi:hypothetical protein